ncbi:MAG: hypothetical protein QM790_05885 [Nibricoccus sp.]
MMKTVYLILLMLGLSFTATAFEVITPEAEKAGKAWEKTIRGAFDFDALRKFLVATIAEQKRKDDVDLTVSRVDDRWTVVQHRRVLVSGDWCFVCDGDVGRFQFRYYYGKEYEVVFVCKRIKKDSFRLLEVRVERASVHLAYEGRPNQMPGRDAT